jgi:hypothetical protein
VLNGGLGRDYAEIEICNTRTVLPSSDTASIVICFTWNCGQMKWSLFSLPFSLIRVSFLFVFHSS